MKPAHGRIASCLFAFTACLAAAMAQAQPAAEAPQHRAQKPTTYESKQDLGKGITLARMTNGMTVIVAENHASPVATVRCFVNNTGSVYEGKWNGAGISHLVEHLVAGGSTKRRSEEEIRKIIDTMGGRTNAYTSLAVTNYYIDCPGTRAAEAIELIADQMQYTLFLKEEYQRELGVVQRELEMGEADRDRAMFKEMQQLVYQNHPMRHPIIGYLPVLQQVTHQDVIDFYKSRYVPQNMTFIVAGDVQTDETLATVLENFKTFQRTTERQPTLPQNQPQASARSSHREMEGDTTRYAVAWPTVRLQHPDLYALDVASYLLTNGDSSRLRKRLMVDAPLAVGVSSSSYTPGYVEGYFEVDIECAPRNVETCRKIMVEEIGKLARELVSEKELAKVKKQKASDHVFGQQTVQNVAESLSSSYRSTGDPLFDEQYVAGIQKVTPKQVQAVIRKYFRPETENVVRIDPVGSAKVTGPGDLAGDVESDVMKKVLPNGLTLLVKRNAIAPLVNVQAFALAGMLSDNDEKSGRAALAASVMTLGTEKHTAEEIAEYFDASGGYLTVSPGRNTTYLQSAVLKEDFTTALGFVDQVLFHPTFPADRVAKERELQLTRIAARKANPQAEIMDFFAAQLPRDTHYHLTVSGKVDSVKDLTAADLKQFHDKYFVPGNMVIAVYGDIDPAKTVAMLERTFGDVPPGDVDWPKFPVDHMAKAPVSAVLENNQPDTAMVLMGYPTTRYDQTETREALSVVANVLTGGFGGRLFRELRGARLVYYVHGFESTGPAPGYFMFLAQTRPETADEVIERIQAGVAKLEKEGIPADELSLVKQKLIASHSLGNTTPGEQAFDDAVKELYGVGYDHDDNYAQRVNAVSSEDVQRIVKKYFRNPVITKSRPKGSAAE